MTMLYKEGAKVTCPSCGASWELDPDGEWYSNKDHGLHNVWGYYRHPIEDRGFCPECARDTASISDAANFVQEYSLEKEFLLWLIGAETDREARNVFQALTCDDTSDRDDFLAVRLYEFITDRCMPRFAEWRCGD